jgi:putative membrane protein insertion efficiency factor
MRRSKTPIVILAVTAAAFFAVAVHDLVVPLPEQYATRAAIFSIERYRALISPRLKGRVVCRFEPTCSAYGLESVKKYGAVRGGWRTAVRIARCGPWTPAGTVDPP